LRRLALEGDRVVADAGARLPGRGAYVCDAGCLQTALTRRALARAFRRSVDLGPSQADLLESVRI
jgi:predicted RNA-binding protein YlxR (DUF448 family)